VTIASFRSTRLKTLKPKASLQIHLIKKTSNSGGAQFLAGLRRRQSEHPVRDPENP